MSEHLDAFDAVIDSWREGDEVGDPVQFLREYLTEPVFDASLVDHAARNLVWDYSDGDLYRDWIMGTVDYWPDADFRSTTLMESSDPEWYVSREGIRLSASSYTLVPIPSGWSDDDVLTVRLGQDGDAAGGCSPHFAGRVIQLDGADPTYIGLSAEAEHDTVSVDNSEALWLAVANVATLDECPGSAAFKVSFVRLGDPPPTPPGDTGQTEPDTGATEPSGWDPNQPSVSARSKELGEPGGCACASTKAEKTSWLWTLVPLLALHRRSTRNS